MSDWKLESDKIGDLEQQLLDNSDIMTVAHECWKCAKDHGFPLEDKLPQLVAFMGEVGEWCEAVRKGDQANELEEVVDCMVRLFAYAQEHYEPIWRKALFSKMEYNRGREYKHGKNF